MEATWISPAILEPRLNADFYRECFIANALRRDRVPCKPLEQLRQKDRRITNGIRGPELLQSDYRMLRIQDLDGPFFRSEGALRISEKQYRENRRAWCQQGDILVSIGGELRLAGMVVDASPQVIGQHSGLLPIDRTQIENEFALIYLSTDTGKRDLARYMAGSAQLGIDLDDLREIKVPTPERPLQIAIGNKVRKAERLRELARQNLRFVSNTINGLYGPMDVNVDGSFGWLDSDHLSPTRLDAWFNQTRYVQFGDLLDSRTDLVKVRTFCVQATDTVDWADWPSDMFQYFEIGDMESQSGQISAQRLHVSDAPSRAKFIVQPWDLLISTIRPNMKSICPVPEVIGAAVCSSGFSVLRAASPAVAGYLWACLVHDVATRQLMRWSTGATYPAIDRSVPLDVLVPSLGAEKVIEVGEFVVDATRWNGESRTLIENARTEVEALIDGTLDKDRLLDQGEEIAAWLVAHPLPSQGKGVGHAS